jgi:UDP-N-acetylmuramate dehydrogenase
MLPEIHNNVSLAKHSTMRLGGRAKHLAEAHNESAIKQLADWAKSRDLPIIMIGEGSNIVWQDKDFEGLVIVNRIPRKKIIKEDSKSATIEIGSGEYWDEVVAWTVKNKWSGLEFLSLIPGYAGAAPVQNIGAYGGELSNVFIELEAYDTHTGKFVKIKKKDCGFGYRTSRFKTTDKHRFLITSLKLKLSKSNPKPPFYESLQAYFTEHKIKEFTPLAIREAVMSIRPAKLPDPSRVANNGSFFTNPIITNTEFQKLFSKSIDIKYWQHGNKIKLSAAWLVEQAGFKDFHDKETGMGTWPNQCLVLVNENAKNSDDLLAFKTKIVKAVHDKFGIILEQEPELLP